MGEKYNYSICKEWQSNIESLTLQQVTNLKNISPHLFLKGLNNIQFTTLKTIDTKYWGQEEYCDLQTKSFESTQQLVNAMKLLNSNTKLENVIDNVRFETAIDAKIENTMQRDEYFEQISDILFKWMKNPYKRAFLQFKISNTSDENSDFKYCEQLATCLSNKNKIEDENVRQLWKSLKEEQFIGPYYGGDSIHFYNTISINDRLRVAVHMPQIQDDDMNTYELEREIEFVVEMKASTVGHILILGPPKDLINCTCQSSRAGNSAWRLRGYSQHFGTPWNTMV